MPDGWRGLPPHELREELRKASWRSNKLDGHSIDTLVRHRTTPTAAALIEDVLRLSPTAARQRADTTEGDGRG